MLEGVSGKLLANPPAAAPLCVSCMSPWQMKARAALDALTVEEHGVDGRAIYM